MLVSPRASIMRALTAVIESGVSWRRCSRNCAVTMMEFESSAAAGAGAGAGALAAGAVAGGSCARAGVATPIPPASAVNDMPCSKRPKRSLAFILSSPTVAHLLRMPGQHSMLTDQHVKRIPLFRSIIPLCGINRRSLSENLGLEREQLAQLPGGGA